MIGQLKFTDRGWTQARRENLYGLPVLRTQADPQGWLGERRIRKAGCSLWRCGIFRTLTPAGFDHWDVLEEYGLVPVDPVGFLRAQSAPLTLGLLERRGMAPDRATVALRGLRADRDMARAATQLCPLVRHLVISAPRGGEELALWLRQEFGVPILPQGEEAAVTLRFHPTGEEQAGRTLDLYGRTPKLEGLTLSVPTLAEGDRSDLPLLAALWEGGRLQGAELKIT